jgi:chorismate synthase
VVDGCPPGLLSARIIQKELDAESRALAPRHRSAARSDTVEILSGVYEGAPPARDRLPRAQRGRSARRTTPRSPRSSGPGHADYTYLQKYGVRDPRGGGRASARETVVRVAAGRHREEVAEGRSTDAWCAAISRSSATTIPFHRGRRTRIHSSRQMRAGGKLEKQMDALREAGDSCGARVNVVASGVPVGWGEPVYGRLDADIAAAMMGINAVKGVEIGAGFAAIEQKGSEHGDEMTPQGFLSTTTAACSAASPPARSRPCRSRSSPRSSIRVPRRTIDRAGKATDRDHRAPRPCVGIRATPIAEAMLACVLMDHALRHRAQCADVSAAVPRGRKP